MRKPAKSLVALVLVAAFIVGILPPVPVYAAGSLTAKTLAATDIGTDCATLRGKVLTNGGYNIESYGFMVEIDGEWEAVGWEWEHIDSNDVYEYEIDGLEPGTTYRFEFDANSENGNISPGYGGILTFTTDCDHEYEEDIIKEEYDYDDYKEHWFSQKIEYTCEYCGDSYIEWTDEEYEDHEWDSATSTCELCDCALPGLTIENFSIKDEYKLGDVIKFSGRIDGNGGKILRVQVNVERPGEESDEHLSSRSVNGNYFNLTNVADLTLDKEGEWGVFIWAVDMAENGYNSEDAENGVGTFVYYFDVVDDCDHQSTKEVETWWQCTKITGNDEQHTYSVTYKIVCKDCGVTIEEDLERNELEDHDFDSDGKCTECGYILSHEPTVRTITPASTLVNTVKPLGFIIKTNIAAEYGIALYADDILLAEVTEYDTCSDYLEYTYEHRFMSAGDKNIYAYPLDANGNCIKDTGASCSIRVDAPYGQVGQPKIDTPNNTVVSNGNPIMIEWTAPSYPANGVMYNLYLYDYSTEQDIFVNEELITGTSFTIPASAFVGEGYYMVHLYALAEGYTQSDSVKIDLKVSGGKLLLGDVNSDGVVTNKDRFILNRYIVGMTGYTNINTKAADINGDGLVTTMDSIILTRHLAKWPGYEDLSLYHKEPEVTPGEPDDPSNPSPEPDDPVGDTSKWQMSFSSNAVNINVSLASGTPDASKDYLFIAEDTEGRHYFSTISAGQTSASYSIKSLQMTRAQFYTYYVIPNGMPLVPENKEQYKIGSGYVPLFNGDMITSVTIRGLKVSQGATIYSGETLTVKWDGSLGVEQFSLVATMMDITTKEEKVVLAKEYSNSGPGTTTIDCNASATSILKITGTVKAPYGTDLTDAVSEWTCVVTPKPDVSEPDVSYSLYEMRDELAIAIKQAYARDSLDAQNNYGGVSGVPIHIVELLAKGILGGVTYEIEQGVRNADAGIDNGREIINQMVLGEALKIDVSWSKFVKEISSLPPSIINNFTSKEAEVLFLFTELTDAEYIILLDGDQNAWAKNEKLKKLWLLMGDEAMQNTATTDTYRLASKKLSSTSINILSKIGNVAEVVDKGVNLFETGAKYLLEYLYKDEIDQIIDSWIAASDDESFQAELRKYKSVYSSQLSVIINTLTDSGFASSELKDITYLMAKKGLFGSGIQNMIGKIGKSAFMKAISQADTVLFANQLIYKYLLGCDIDAVYSSLSNLLTIDQLYRQEVEDVNSFRFTSFDFGAYIKDLRLAAVLAKQEYQYYIVILENTLIFTDAEDEQYAKQLIEDYKSFVIVIDEWLDPYIAALTAAKDADACI